MIRLSFLLYLEFLGKKKGNLTIAEVGVYKGDNAAMMLEKAGGLINKIYLIDSYKPNDPWFTDHNGEEFTEEKAKEFYENTKKRFQDYKQVQVIRKSSEDACQYFPDEYFDYVYIDGGHDYHSVIRDISFWYPKVKPFGMLAGHDVMYRGVSQAIAEFALERKITSCILNVIKGRVYLNEFGDWDDWWLLRLDQTDKLLGLLTGP